MEFVHIVCFLRFQRGVCVREKSVYNKTFVNRFLQNTAVILCSAANERNGAAILKLRPLPVIVRYGFDQSGFVVLPELCMFRKHPSTGIRDL
jgi:hypothetical protein